MLTTEQGTRLVRLARQVIEQSRIFDLSDFQEKVGAFVSLYSWPSKELRGCIGFVEPCLPLSQVVQRAALAAAFNDPRFPPLQPDELDQVTLEVSVLGKLEPISLEYCMAAKNWRFGLMLKHPPHSGLFLPQVWKYFNNVEEFLEHLCYKAGLTPDYLYHPNTKLFKFSVQAFAEVEPRGKVLELHF